MKIAVLLSGGVDSSVALNLLKEQGHNITAFYLKIWLEDELSFLGNCPWEEDLNYAQAVCKKANVPLQVINMQKEYHNQVVFYAISEVKAGGTPSPDIFCNKLIKFGCFLEKFGDQFDKIATGHYAQLDMQNNKFLLKKAVDPIKDQTYFLSHLNQNQLSKILFPLGNFKKSEVRDLAKKYDLPNKDRKDSQGICFLGKIEFNDFIKHHAGTKRGDLVEFESGKKVGEHEGFWFYTIGQRRGIRLSDGPWFVIKKDAQKNIVYVSNKYHSEDKKRDEFEVNDFNWISGEKPDNPSPRLRITGKTNFQTKIRHGEKLYNCELKFTSDNSAVVKLDEQDQGLASGQFAVFYDGDICLGCGKIG